MPDFDLPELGFRRAHEVRDVVAQYRPTDHLRLRGEARIQGMTFPPGSPVRVTGHRAYSVNEQYEVEVTGPDGNTAEFNTSERSLDHLVERYVELHHWTRSALVAESLLNAAVRTPEVIPVREPVAQPGRTAWEWLDEDAV